MWWGAAPWPHDQPRAYESQPLSVAAVYDPREIAMNADDVVVAAADGSHLQGAMIALIPSDEDAARLAIDGGETAADLHLTLAFLGDGDDWSGEQRAELVELVRARVAELTGPVAGNLFGAAHWNPGSDDPAWVWSTGDHADRPDDAPTLGDAQRLALDALDALNDRPDLPRQHSPWAAHITAAYSPNPELLAHLEDRLGPVTLDRIRVTFAGHATDIHLGPEPAREVTAAADPSAEPRAWTTPQDTALAYEDQETGDGRIFAAGALYWETGPWPLQYADEMLGGHDGAELAGSIEEMGRDGDRITGTGVLYTHRPAGADAAALLDEGAPLGVSVDLDDVDLEILDRTTGDDDGDGLVLVASLSGVRALRLPDGGWHLTATAAPSITASGAAVFSTSTQLQLITGPGGQLPRDAVTKLGAALGTSITAGAGDPDPGADGTVVHTQRAGDTLLRITRGRVRGATLVAVPAYADARIVLAPLPGAQQRTAAGRAPVAAAGELTMRVVHYVASSPIAVGARETAAALRITMEQARAALRRAHDEGLIVRLSRGLYVGAVTAMEDDSDGDGELVASAWAAVRDLPPMPAEWFREPTATELPPGSGGVHYAGGRIWGWVARAGEPHAGFAGQNLTIERIARQGLDTTHFLRKRFALDDGSTVRAGAMTMNVGHHRDGAECETDACQFDDTRTVAGIVTVGMSGGGLWFSGAAGPWLSDWDRTVFAACQPSYHMQRAGSGWQLRAVLTVPVPGHSSPLLATAVAERAQLALTAAAAGQADTGADTLVDITASAVLDATPGTALDTGADRPDTATTSTDTPPDTGADSDADTGADESPDMGGQLAAALRQVFADAATLDALAVALEQRATAREIDQLNRTIHRQPALAR